MFRTLRFFLIFITSFAVVLSAYAITKQVPKSKEELIFSYAPLVKTSSAAVVNIYTKKKVKVTSGISPFFNDPIFKNFWGNRFSPQQTEKIQSSLGSGVIVSEDGHIITNNHVLQDGADITVVLSDRREYPAKIVLNDEKTDLALLKIDSEDELSHMELMDSDKLEVGDIVLAIGNPFGVGQTVTSGIVSAVARTAVGISDYQFFIQTDAAINPGNSGGALVNMEGKLAGINTAIYTRSGGSNGIGFAIPANMVATVIRNSTGDGHVTRPWLGISVQPVSFEIAKSLGLKTPTGAIVSAVYPGGPVDNAGIKVGDIIVNLDDHQIMDEHSLHFRVATYEIGQTVKFGVIRAQNYKNIIVEMAKPIEEPERDLRVLEGNHPLSGVTVANISPALADELGINFMLEGVIVTAMEQSIASRLGFNNKDIIKKVNGVDIKTTKNLEKLLKKEQSRWTVTVQRGSRVLNIIWSNGFN